MHYFFTEPSVSLSRRCMDSHKVLVSSPRPTAYLTFSQNSDIPPRRNWDIRYNAMPNIAVSLDLPYCYGMVLELPGQCIDIRLLQIGQ